MDIKGHVVKRVWIEHASDIAEEYYASFTLDRAAKKYLGMLSAQGGVDIEQVAESAPDAIARLHLDPVAGLSEAECRAWVEGARLNPAATDGAVDILDEAVPRVRRRRRRSRGDQPVDPDARRTVHALDAKVSLDENAAFRHPEWDEYAATQELDDRERLAREKGLNYIGLDGTVGIIGNGAGLVMSTLDVVNQVGGAAANFLDVGGGADANVLSNAIEVINTDENVRAILVNIFGGHHPLRRGRERHRHRARAGEGQGADRHPSRRDERRRGPGDHQAARIRSIDSQPTMLDAARKAVELASK